MHGGVLKSAVAPVKEGLGKSKPAGGQSRALELEEEGTTGGAMELITKVWELGSGASSASSARKSPYGHSMRALLLKSL